MSQARIIKVSKLIEASIERCQQAEDAWQRARTNASLSLETMRLAKERLENAEREFGWQWKNVAYFMSCHKECE